MKQNSNDIDTVDENNSIETTHNDELEFQYKNKFE